MLEDRLLIWKFNKGKRETIERIYAKYKDDLMTLSAALLYDKSSAEDVVHDVFVKFIRSCGQMRLNQSLKGYLITCVVNTARNKNKAGQRRKDTSLDKAVQFSSNLHSPDLAAMFNENSQKLALALTELPYEQREVLLLHLYSGLKFKAIAEMQNELISTIQGRYRYGLNKLRSLLNGEVEK
ncbi:MAG: RNA polymerase sigma factor [Sedimentisphaerales bacterium]|nr:RNA polymerase sigma factor [Sedimentisphaerales bacterium]